MAFAAHHALLTQMSLIAVCVAVYFVIAYGAAQKWLDPFILQLRRLTANESVTSCVLALVLVYAIFAEWLGSVAGITGAYLLGYVFAGSEYKGDIERTFYALGHGLFIPLFFVSIGLSSDFRALGGHWLLLGVISFIAVISKVIGCGLAALARGMGTVPSFRVGCGMVSRGEVGLIVTAMGAASGIFKHVMVLAEDHIKLMDFGLAGQVGARRVTFTNLAEIISNGNYLSPEQIAGNRGDARSDLYALGVILYELLTGKLTYGSSSSLEQFNSRLLRDPAPMRSLDPTISPELEEIVHRALERDPVHRYATAREFAHDLAHPETVTIDKNRGSEGAKPLRPAKSKTSKVSIVIYALLAAIPALIFLAILITSRHK